MRNLIYNKMIKILSFIFLTLLINFSQLLKAQEIKEDSLNYFLNYASENNPLLKSKYNEYLSFLEKIPQVSSLQDPELSTGFFLTSMEILSGKQIADFRIMQMFPWFGTLKSAKDEAQSMANAKLELYNESKLMVHNDLKTIWFQLYRNKKEIDYNNETIEFLKSLENIVLFRYKNVAINANSNKSMSMGSMNNSKPQSNQNEMNSMSSQPMNNMPNSDSKLSSQSMNMQNGSSMGNSSNELVSLFRVQMQILDLDNTIKLLKDEQKTLIAKFNSLLNRDLSTNITIAETLQNNIQIHEFQTAVDSIKANNPMIMMLEAEKTAYEYKALMSKKMSYPMLGIGLNYSLIAKSSESTSMMNGKDMIMPMATVTLPIFRKKYNAMIKESELMQNSIEDQLVNYKNFLESSYIKTLEDINDAKRKIKINLDKIELAQRSVNLLIAEYSASGNDFEEILRMQIQLLDYKTLAVKALVEYNISHAIMEKLLSKTK